MLLYCNFHSESMEIMVIVIVIIRVTVGGGVGQVGEEMRLIRESTKNKGKRKGRGRKQDMTRQTKRGGDM